MKQRIRIIKTADAAIGPIPKEVTVMCDVVLDPSSKHNFKNPYWLADKATGEPLRDQFGDRFRFKTAEIARACAEALMREA